MLFSAVTFVLNNSFSTDKLVSEPELRTRIADDLLNNYELAGKTEEEIIALLGKNDTDIGYFNADNRYVYCLGAERGFIGIDNEWLIINFVDGRASEYNLITD